MDKNINEHKFIKRQIELTQKSPSLSFCVWKETGAKARVQCAGSERNIDSQTKAHWPHCLCSVKPWRSTSTVSWGSLAGPALTGLGKYLYGRHNGIFKILCLKILTVSFYFYFSEDSGKPLKELFELNHLIRAVLLPGDFKILWQTFPSSYCCVLASV